MALFMIGLLLGGVVSALVKSRPGQRYVLDLVLERARNGLAGTLTVDAIRSGSLLSGATLEGVHLVTSDGRPFLDADSVTVRYSLLSLVGAAPRIASVALFGPRVVISRYPDEERPNVSRVFLPAPTGDSARARGPGVRLGRIRVEAGTLEVLTPLAGSAPPRVPTVPVPGGEGLLRRISLDGVGLELTAVRIGGEGGDVLAASLGRLAMGVSVLDRPLTVADLQGQVRFGSQGLVLSDATLRTPGGAFDGGLTLGPQGADSAWALLLDLQTQGPVELNDLRWLDDRIPDGVLRGGVGVVAGGALDVRLRQLRVELEASRLAFDGGIHVDGGVSLRDLEIEASPLALARLEPWIGRQLGVDGWLSGRMALRGPMSSLVTDGRVTLVPTGFGGRPTTADVQGILHLGRNPGVTDLRAVLDPLSYDVLAALDPRIRLSGDGRVDLQASGRMSEAFRFVADVRQGSDLVPESRVLAQGSTRRDEDREWVLDVQGDVSPLSLALLRDVVPDLNLTGALSGSVRAVGPLRDLRLSGELEGGGGRFSVDGVVDASAPGRSYRAEATLDGVELSGLFADLPEPSVWSGSVQLEGRGLRADSLEASATVTAGRSRIGGLHVDTLHASVRASGGVLAVDTVQALLGGLAVEGSGTMGLVSGAEGLAHVAFRTDDLFGLRPLLMGDEVIAGDTLSVLEEASLRMEGVDVEALPDSADVAFAGALSGELTLSGALPSLAVQGTVGLRDALYGRDHVGSADVRLEASDVLQRTRVVQLDVDARELAASGREFRALAATVLLEGRRGEGTLAMERAGGDRYSAKGAFALDSVGGGDLRVDEAMIYLDSLAWHLERPAQVRWDTTSVTFEDLEVTRQGEDPMRLRAAGTLSSEGSSDLLVRLDGLHLDQLARVAEWEELGLGGHLDLELAVTGPAVDPVIHGSFRVEEPRYGEMTLHELSGSIDYAEQVAQLSLGARDLTRQVFSASGAVPVDLSLRPGVKRIVPREMDVRVVADSLDAAVALSYLAFLEDVEGVVSGDFRVRGVLDRPAPSGTLRLDRAAWTLEALEIRHTDVSGTLALNPDRTVDVTVDGRATGSSSVRGRVVLDPLSDPRLDLTIGFQGFQALDRRDMTGLMSGEVKLVGSYRAPRIEGNLTVDRGTLFVEEFARSVTVVDLTDPRIYEVVDTMALATRPLLAGMRNPFLQNLVADVGLSVPRDTWMRSEDMNVEMGGDLRVLYDRMNRDIVMVGELQALRGSYTAMGRRFDVESGTIAFIGTPGVNPSLDIQAVSRIRRVGLEPLAVTANVTGTLTQPRVTLSSEEQGVAESDLVSYLIFGRPSYELATGEEAVLAGAAGSFVGAAAGAGVTFLSGTLATRLGAALSQQWGLDYLSITQAGDYGVASMRSNPLQGAQVEVGEYLTDNLFFILVFRPKPEPGTGQKFFGGARVEVALNDDYNVQGFWEDRFLRSGLASFGQLVPAQQVVGIFIFREWGY